MDLAPPKPHDTQLSHQSQNLNHDSCALDGSMSGPRRLRGPGLPESLGWILLFIFFQLGAMVIVVIMALAFTLESVSDLQNFDFSAWFDSLSPTAKLGIVASPGLGCYLALVPLGLWRMSPRPLAKLDLNLPTGSQTLVTCSLILPLTIIADAVMRILEPIWQWLMNQFSVLQFFAGTDVHQVLGELNQSSLVLALFLIAIVPAFGEEFLFRGLIGRGLTARWGLILGVAITSFLFAAVHLYPPHVIAILPVAVALHVIYLTTRSFWAPVLFHFLNNALATVMMRVDQSGERPSSVLLTIATAYFIWCLYWLFQMRTEYQSQSTRVSKTYALPCVVALLVVSVSLYEIASHLIPNLASLLS